MSIQRDDFHWASIGVVAGVAPALNYNLGFVSAFGTVAAGQNERVGAGDYRMLLDPNNSQVDPVSSTVTLNLRSAVDARGVVERVSDQEIRVRTFSAAGAPADVNFDLKVSRVTA